MHILYNPLANNMHGAQSAAKIKQTIDRDNMTFEDITQIDDITDYILSLDDNEIVIAGGDGTLNRFINNFENKLNRHLYILIPTKDYRII